MFYILKHWNCLIHIVYYLFKYTCYVICKIIEIRYDVAFHCFCSVFDKGNLSVFLYVCVGKERILHFIYRILHIFHVNKNFLCCSPFTDFPTYREGRMNA